MALPNPNVGSAISVNPCTKRKEPEFLQFESKSEKSRNFFIFFWKITNGPIKERKCPIPIRTLAQRFPDAIVRKGKNRSFSNLNLKARNLKIKKKKKKSRLDSQKSANGIPIRTKGQTFLWALNSKGKKPEFFKSEPNGKKVFFLVWEEKEWK